MKEQLQKLWTALDEKKGHNLSMIIGLDGFVDEIVHLVGKRHNARQFDRIPTMAALSERIGRAAGLSTNIEVLPLQVKLGGNGPILSNALISYGVKLSYIGALGNPVHPVFEDMAGKCEKIYPLCEAAYNQGIEFDDGKLLMGKLEVLNEITWERFKEVVGSPSEIAALIGKCDLFGLENWTMVLYMNQIMQGLINEVFPLMADSMGVVKPLAFFDLADPEKRSEEDILEAMKLIGKFESKFRTILGLNEKEMYQIAKVLGVKENGLKNTTVETYKKLGIYCLAVHPVKEAACCINGEYYQVKGPYCEKPLLTTGAGDNFNAGFCLGQALGFKPMDSLTLGVSTSGYYVRNAKSPTYVEIMGFVKEWHDSGSI